MVAAAKDNGIGFTSAELAKAFDFWGDHWDVCNRADPDIPNRVDHPMMRHLAFCLDAARLLDAEKDERIAAPIRTGAVGILALSYPIDGADYGTLGGAVRAALLGITLNPDYDLGSHGRGVYVIHCGDGCSCNGYNYVHRRTGEIADWLHANGDPVQSLLGMTPTGTVEAFALYQRLIDRAAELCRLTGKRCTIELKPQLIGLEGHRVEVLDCYGERRRFIVGKSTGWMPCHLEISRRNSSGGPAVMGTPFRQVRDLGTSR